MPLSSHYSEFKPNEFSAFLVKVESSSSAILAIRTIGSDTRTVGISSRNVAMKKESSKPMNVLRDATT
jgi:hypothetical protein